MNATKIVDGIYKVGVNLPNTRLFEGLWPIPKGASINGYVVQGDEIALIDLVQDFEDLPKEYQEELAAIGIEQKKISYLIVNHMEPDHTGWLGTFIKNNPHVKIYCTAKTVPMLSTFYDVASNVIPVKTGDTLDLGQGKVLEFFETPNVHWPETMMVFERSNGILFSCDAFGGYGAVASDKSFDDTLDEATVQEYIDEAIRYYANIVAAFSPFVTRAINQLAHLPIKIIAPSHGLIWRKDVARIVNLYSTLAGYATNAGDPKKITLIWGSMYGNTERAVTFIRKIVEDSGIEFFEHRVPEEEIGMVLASVWQSRGIILAMPTYEYQMFPPVAHVLDDAFRKKMFNKHCLRMGSFGWVGGAEKEVKSWAEKLKWQMHPSIEWAGTPTEAEIDKIRDGIHALIKTMESDEES
ncbi:FprA family A-type flavoprotein [Entomospira culicis]|uniref:FprA family A-type flavoprotein n=1 Tax=Entomospira culicis TaxID=2719989 RepID=A0A968GJ08_9SPIO|nr:FprA family A-type flavoprotein [Entomospira culicis]NIZ19256.1 FprA family A-type flavoprotein [Entomospira culicis]NIZ69839.1 FprA family A-type flavoprotein [Entomospira culicis]WDI36945.1 FprA family A-type flavoprotein [Entomospira culicis]WDI38574.1 FprA family A-type flavoprotein [Entomospira culicis]